MDDDRRPATKIKDGSPGKNHQPTGGLKTAKTAQYFQVLEYLDSKSQRAQSHCTDDPHFHSLPTDLVLPFGYDIAPELCGNISSALAPMVTSQPTALFPAKVADLEILARRADEASPFRVWRAQRRKGTRTVCSLQLEKNKEHHPIIFQNGGLSNKARLILGD